MKTVKDILRNKILQSISINANAMVIDAMNRMESKNLDYVIVVENNVCVGVMSEADYLRKIILARKDPRQMMVKEIMTHCIHAIDIEEPILKCMSLMDTFKIRHLLVFEGLTFKGVLTLHDLMQASVEENLDNIQEQEKLKYNLSSYYNGINNANLI